MVATALTQVFRHALRSGHQRQGRIEGLRLAIEGAGEGSRGKASQGLDGENPVRHLVVWHVDLRQNFVQRMRKVTLSDVGSDADYGQPRPSGISSKKTQMF